MRAEFSGIDFSKLGSAVRSLHTRWGGLAFLAGTIAHLEERKKQRDPDWQRSVVEVGDNPDEEQIYNFFLWYACSFFAFAQLLDKAAGIEKFEDHPPFRGIITWRNKVAAHTSFAVPRRDNFATQIASLRVMPTWKGKTGTYEEGGWAYSGAGQGVSNDEWRWSLTLIHRDLYAYVISVLASLPSDFTPIINEPIHPIVPYSPKGRS